MGKMTTILHRLSYGLADYETLDDFAGAVEEREQIDEILREVKREGRKARKQGQFFKL